MSYDYDKTSVDLYRAVFKSNFETDVGRYLKPDRELADSESIAPILHPTLAESAGKPFSRPPDIVANKQTGMFEPDSGGTSVFDRAGVLRRADGDFFIPAGTDIPPDLTVKKDSFNERLKATHFTIMPSEPLFKSVLPGQLDNFVRSAIRRQYEQARGL